MDLELHILEFLHRQRVGRLATVTPRGGPHVIPVCYAVVGDRIYSVVDEKPKRTQRLQRLRNLEANPAAALLVDRYDADWSRLAWVLLRGRAETVVENGERRVALEALRERYRQYRSMALEDAPLLRISPQRINTWGLDTP